jgi:hypothetical protein
MVDTGILYQSRVNGSINFMVNGSTNFMPSSYMPFNQLSGPISFQLHSQSPLSQLKTELDSKTEPGQRIRGRPRGSKDKQPRKRRPTKEGSSTHSNMGGEPLPLSDHGLERNPRPLPLADGAPFESRSPAANHSGRHKPWKIVLTKEDAEDIYRARATGKLAAAVCSRLAEQHSVHSKVRARGAVSPRPARTEVAIGGRVMSPPMGPSRADSTT